MENRILFPCGWKNLREWAHKEGVRRWGYKEPFVPVLKAVKAAKHILSLEDAEKWLVRNFAPRG